MLSVLTANSDDSEILEKSWVLVLLLARGGRATPRPCPDLLCSLLSCCQRPDNKLLALLLFS